VFLNVFYQFSAEVLFHRSHSLDLEDDRPQPVCTAADGDALLLVPGKVPTMPQRPDRTVDGLPSRRAETLGHSMVLLHDYLLAVLVDSTCFQRRAWRHGEGLEDFGWAESSQHGYLQLVSVEHLDRIKYDAFA
jgi:hypothetical protein